MVSFTGQGNVDDKVPFFAFGRKGKRRPTDGAHFIEAGFQVGQAAAMGNLRASIARFTARVKNPPTTGQLIKQAGGVIAETLDDGITVTEGLTNKPTTFTGNKTPAFTTQLPIGKKFPSAKFNMKAFQNVSSAANSLANEFPRLIRKAFIESDKDATTAMHREIPNFTHRPLNPIPGQIENKGQAKSLISLSSGTNSRGMPIRQVTFSNNKRQASISLLRALNFGWKPARGNPKRHYISDELWEPWSPAVVNRRTSKTGGK